MLMRRILLEFINVCAALLLLPIALLVLLVVFALMTPWVLLIELLNVLDWVAERDWMAQQLWVMARKRPVVSLWNVDAPFVATVLNTGRQAADGTPRFTSTVSGRGPPVW